MSALIACVASMVGGSPMGATTTAAPGTGLTLDIHVMLDAETTAKAVEANDKIHQLCPTDEVDLGGRDVPHITLYLTEFVETSLDAVIAAVEETMAGLAGPTVDLSNTYVSGDFGMWNVTLNDQLQAASDAIVNATVDYIVPNQPVPGWVYSLPEPERSEKIAMVKKYGSPNVFSQFDPHVTLAWNNATSCDLTTVFDELALQPASYVAGTVAIALVGPHGTVLAGTTVGSFEFGSSK